MFPNILSLYPDFNMIRSPDNISGCKGRHFFYNNYESKDKITLKIVEYGKITGTIRQYTNLAAYS